MNKDELRLQLSKEGFPHIYEWNDAPGTEYPAHVHHGAVALYILEGGLTFKFGAETVELKNGERFDVPIGQEHSAKVGPDGCVFLVGEMIEGDS